jgi:hypothetical protein
MQPFSIEPLFAGNAGAFHIYLAVDMGVAQIDRAAELHVAQVQPADMQPLCNE